MRVQRLPRTIISTEFGVNSSSRLVLEPGHTGRQTHEVTAWMTNLLNKFFGDVRTGLVGKRYHQWQYVGPSLSPHVASKYTRQHALSKYPDLQAVGYAYL